MCIETEGTYLSCDGKTQIHYDLYLPEGAPRAILQICHGMTEHMGRYRRFAQFLAEQGVVVCGNDHLGHGKTGTQEDRGYFAEENGPELLVGDVEGLRLLMRAKYRTLPYLLLGHSMGSFIARLYLTRYPGAVDGAILSGTSGAVGAERLAKGLASFLKKQKGARARSPFLIRTVNGNFTKRFRGEDARAWLTRDKEIQARYAADPDCNFTFTVGGYYDLFSMLCAVNEQAWFESVPKDLPLMLLSGEMDPVGEYGVGVRKVYDRLSEAEVSDLTLRLYPGGRHEMLNEMNRDEVYGDVLAFVEHVVQGVLALRIGVIQL